MGERPVNRLFSWLGGAPAAPRQPPARRQSNQPNANSRPTTQPSNTSSPAARTSGTRSPNQQKANSKPSTQPTNTPSQTKQPPNQSTETTMPASTTAQRPPFRPGGRVTPTPGSQSQASKTESDLPSPARANTQSRANQPATPARPTTQSEANSKPSSPSLATTQTEATSLPSSSNPATSQLPSTSQSASEPLSESVKDRELKPTNEVVRQNSSPSKTAKPVTPDSTRLPSTFKQAQPSGNDKEEARPAENSESLTNIQRNDKAGQSKELSPEATSMSTRNGGSETPVPTQKSNSANMNHRTEHIAESDKKPEITKEVAEIVQEIKDKDLKEAKESVNQLQMKSAGSTERIKEPQNTAAQAEQMLMEKRDAIGNGKTAAVSMSKQNEGVTQAMEKTMIGDSHQQPAISKGDDVFLHKEIKNEVSKFLRRKTSGDLRSSRDGTPLSVITLAGDNRGASMQLGSESSSKNGGLHIHRSYKLNPDESTEANTDGEGSSKRKEAINKNATEDQAPETYINSNTQGINNSILFNCSITLKDPGVHLVQTRTSTEPIKPIDRKGTPETHKAEYNITQAQKLTYEPTIRRRCLKGLFLESSDSDSDNPDKPRRHGCRVGCSERYQSNKIDIL